MRMFVLISLFWVFGILGIQFVPVEYSLFPGGFLAGVVCLTVIWAFDAFVFRDFDVVEELKKGNIAIPLFYLALAVSFGFGMLAMA